MDSGASEPALGDSLGSSGQVEWDAIDNDVVWITTTRLTQVVRAVQIESFTLDRLARRTA